MNHSLVCSEEEYKSMKYLLTFIVKCNFIYDNITTILLLHCSTLDQVRRNRPLFTTKSN